MPGSFEDDRGGFFPESFAARTQEEDMEEGRSPDDNEESYDDGAIFDDDIFAAGEMRNVPF